MKENLFNKDFTLLSLGQIISLFGNAILRFALPLYLLRETGSPFLFGIVMACSFVPLVFFSLVGGILADRANKRNIMVGLDLTTAVVVALFYFILGHIALVPLIIVTIMILSAIAGIYQPSVQASLPVLVPAQKLVSANAVINVVGTLSSLLGPVTGGIIFGLWGIYPLLILSVVCFAFSAVMELFIRMPYSKRLRETGIWQSVKTDLRDSFYFIKNDRPIFFSVISIIALFNLTLIPVFIVGLPVVIVKVLNLSDALLGLSEGVGAFGGLLGGLFAALYSKCLKVQKAYYALFICAAMVIVIGFVLTLPLPAIAKYAIITSVNAFALGASSILVIQLFATVQRETPQDVLGKVTSVIVAIGLSAHPIGQTIYGTLLDIAIDNVWIVIIPAGVIGFIISLFSKKVFADLPS